MEWEKVAARAIGEVAFDKAEKSKFTSLNDDFTKRLKDENRVKDEKNVNEKFLQNSPPAKKIWRVEGEKETVRMELSKNFNG
uniref:Uncharacterized protein n=1 Tax=Rhizophagus irregularis (strain DAOM 181602 / DAOM 197198 / MUCL 43194) TaxID=747089 RepID=U9TET7_RHIID